MFYDELGKNQFFNLKGVIKGPLNNLKITKLNLVDSNNTQMYGSINFKNMFGNKDQRFLMDAEF